MHELSPSESVHALNLNKLRQLDITLWTAWHDHALLGCGALKKLSSVHGEIKSMHTPAAMRRRGAVRKILQHILMTSKEQGYGRLSFETGTATTFAPAHRFYESAVFNFCGPFGDYAEDINSVFMTLRLQIPDLSEIDRCRPETVA